MRGLFVAGTGTGVGKTVVSAVLARALRQDDGEAPLRYWKPLQTGWPEDDDAREVARLARLAPGDVAPAVARLALPASPPEAAAAAGVALPARLAPPEACDAPEATTWVVEGAGGLLSPALDDATVADVATSLGLPVVLVARGAVGTLHETAAALEAARARGIEPAGVVVSRAPSAWALARLRSLGAPAPVVVVPDLGPAPSAEAVEKAAAALRSGAEGAALLACARRDRDPEASAEGWVARDARVVWHPYTQHATAPPPVVVVAARGATLRLADGREVLDGVASWWACLHGHGHPAIAAAVARQARTLDHSIFAGATHPAAVRLAERLVERAPPGLSRVFFSDDGSTAVETALKAAVAWHARRGDARRTRLVALEGGYHGDTAGAMSVSDDGPFTRDFAPLRVPVDRTPVPADEDGVPAAVASLERLLERGGGAHAAVVLEPVLQAAAGMRVHPPRFVAQAARVARAHGALVIADEVATGFGRTGPVFACALAGLAPDLLCVGKALTGGALPLAATLATEAVFDAFRSPARADAFLHGHTFTGNPTACAAALASLDLLDDRALARGVALGERVRGRLRAALAGDPRAGAVRGIGLVAAVDATPGAGGGYLAEVSAALARAALDRGVLLRPLGDVLYALPPLCATDAEADRVALAMAAAVRSV
jgi:adenosylmethionine-8-amino-7-oxononanoate aminotransferase